MPNELASRIRTARVDAGLSREQLAHELGVSLATLVRYETGRTRRISTDTLVGVAKATGRPISYFLEGVAA